MDASQSQRSFAERVGFDPDYLAAFEQKMFVEGRETSRRLTNFFALLLLATVIATYGVLSDSTATVIGAMIVAPLMGPIMATAAAIVMGQASRGLRSLALVAAGVLTVIAFSWLLTLIVPDVIVSFTENGELASRITPDLYALLTALGAGAAGAYITARAEIADSMGGVAIAISLVPPLCVVGVGLSNRNWSAAGGALLLFLTNFLAILLAGGITFWLGGLGRVAITDQHTRTRRNAFIAVVVGTLLIAIPLGVTTYRAVDAALEHRAATGDVSEWIEGTNHRLVKVEVRDREVLTTVEGSGELRPLKSLANQLAQTLERDVVLTLRVVPVQRQTSD